MAKLCSQPGCHRVALSAGRCDQHHPETPEAWGHDRNADERGYGHAWRKLRKLVLHRDPICKSCGTSQSTTVDHIIPKANGGANSMENLQGLCQRCHDAKTVRDRRMNNSIIYICGAPGSGRRAMVEANRKPGDVCVDLGAIAADAGDRYAALAALGAIRAWWAEAGSGRLLVISSAATGDDLAALQAIGGTGQIVVLDPGEAVCVRRVRDDAARRGRAPMIELEIADWYRRYGSGGPHMVGALSGLPHSEPQGVVAHQLYQNKP